MAGSTFFVAADATVTHTATIDIPNKSANGNLMVTTSAITGSPSGCALAMYSLGANSATAPASAEQTSTWTTTTGTHTQVVAAVSAADITTDRIKAVYTCSTYPTAGTITISFAPFANIATGAITITTPAQVINSSGTLLDTNHKQTAGVALGSMANYGTSPGAVKVEGVNAYVTGGNLTQIAGAAPSATNPLWTVLTDGTTAAGVFSAYGTSPGAVTVPAHNAYVTNTITVSNLTTGDPCLNPQVAKSSAVINTSGAGTTQLVAVSGTKVTYVCQVYFVASATTATALFEYGTSTDCTGTHALTGVITPTAGGTYSMGYGGTIFSSTASNGLCIVNGGTGTQTGFISYVQQ